MKAKDILIVEYAGTAPTLKQAAAANRATLKRGILQRNPEIANTIDAVKSTGQAIKGAWTGLKNKAVNKAIVAQQAGQYSDAWEAHAKQLQLSPNDLNAYKEALDKWLQDTLKVNLDQAAVNRYVTSTKPGATDRYFSDYFIPHYLEYQQKQQAAAQPAAGAQQAQQAQQTQQLVNSADSAFAELNDYIEQGGTVTPKQRGELQSIWKMMGGTQIAESRERRVRLYEGLTPGQVRTVKLWESAGRKLVEADLTAQQISNIFAAVQKDATAAGSNRTIIGRGKDAAGAVADAWDNLKGKVSSSKPIQNMDAAYDSAAAKLKQATGGDQGVMRYVDKYRAFAKKHPVAQSFLYATLIAAAGLSGAGAGGAAALGLFKMADKLLQGEKFSSAAYQGAKTGALAYGASQVADLFKSSTPAPDAATTGPTKGLSSDQVKELQRIGAEGNKMLVRDNALWVQGNDGPTMLTAPKGVTPNQMLDIAQQSSPTPPLPTKAADVISNTPSGTSQIVRSASDVDYNDLLRSDSEYQKFFQAAKQRALDAGLDPAKAHIRAGQAADAKFGLDNAFTSSDKFIKSLQQKQGLKESQIRQIFRRVERRELAEGLMDTVKQAAGKTGEWVRTKGENLTTKVTADKLQQAWKAAGSPMDAEAVAQIIRDAGVSDEIINNVFQSVNVPLSGQTATPADVSTVQTKKLDTTIANIKSYIENGGKITPKMRSEFVGAWKKLGGTQIAEGRQ